MKRFLVAALFLALAHSTALAAYARVQGNVSPDASCTTTSGANIAVSLPLAVTSGNAIFGFINFGVNVAISNLTSITDDKGNSYAFSALKSNVTGDSDIAIFWLLNITNGPITFTANFSPNTNWRLIGVTEISGLTATGAIDGSVAAQIQVSAPTTTDGVTSGNITTLADGDLIYAGTDDIKSSPGTISIGTSFTAAEDRSTATNCRILTEFGTQAAHGTIAGTFTLGSSIDTGTAAIATKISSAAGATVKRLLLMHVGELPLNDGLPLLYSGENR